jgi:ATP-dependent helicase/nuclease subunit A
MAEPTHDQARAIGHLRGPICISAGAGSGKTWVLAQRFAHALTPGAMEPKPDIGDLLAITFTDRAAGELAERVRRQLLAGGLLEDSRRVDEAWIGTIHGFCGRLLRRHALEAGLDPGYSVVADVDAALLREAAVQETIATMTATETAVAALTVEYGRVALAGAVVRAHSKVRGMGADPSSVEPAVRPVSVGETARLACGARVMLEQGIEDLGSCGASGANLDKCLDSSRRALDELDGLEAVRDTLPEGERARLLWELLGAIRLPGPAKDARPIAEALDRHRLKLRERALDAVVASHAAAFTALLAGYAARYAEAKAVRGVVDYDDLQILARDLLTTYPELARRYRERFRIVMVDEFQDTDELQTSLVGMVTDDDLCTVGDDKQSIYGFRNADVEVFKRHVAGMLDRDAVPVTLDWNFRSSADVLDLVNAVFSAPELFGEDLTRLRCGRDASLGKDWPKGSTRIQALFVDSALGNTDTIAPIEAAAVAAAVREMHDRGVPQSDIVVLMRTLKHMRPYAEALTRAGFRVAVAGGGDFFGTPEVAWYIALLGTIANTRDDGALCTVATSPLVGLTDDTLLRARRAADAKGRRPRPGLWGFLAEAARDEDTARTVRLSAAVDGARARVGLEPLSAILLGAVEDLDADLVLLSGGVAGEQAFANLLKLARMADAFEASGGSGLTSFLDHLTLKEQLGDPEAPATIPDDTRPAIRFMTIHAAKGLEFPVVVVPALGRSGGRTSGDLVVAAGEDGILAHVGLPGSSPGDPDARRPAGFRAVVARASEKDAEESKRVFYVACTRAREALVLAGATRCDEAAGTRTTADQLRHGLGLADGVAHGETALELPGSSTTVRIVRVGAPDEPPSPTPDTGPAAHARPGAADETATPAPSLGGLAASPAAVPRELSFSRLDAFADCRLSFALTAMARLGTVRVSGEGGPRDLGDAVHEALRLARDGAPPEPERLAAIASSHSLGPDGSLELERAVSRFLASEWGVRAASSEGTRREVPFVVSLGEGPHVLVGSMDLLVSDEDTALVIDYKTGVGKRSASDAELAEAYRLQAECYALPLLKQGANRVEAVFVMLMADDGHGEPRSVRIVFDTGDHERIERALAGTVREMEQGPYPHRSHYAPACDHCPAYGGPLCDVRGPARSRRVKA